MSLELYGEVSEASAQNARRDETAAEYAGRAIGISGALVRDDGEEGRDDIRAPGGFSADAAVEEITLRKMLGLYAAGVIGPSPCYSDSEWLRKLVD